MGARVRNCGKDYIPIAAPALRSYSPFMAGSHIMLSFNHINVVADEIKASCFSKRVQKAQRPALGMSAPSRGAANIPTMKLTALLLAAAVLSGCASQATLAYRDDMRAACKTGDRNACNILPVIQERVDQEASENGAKIATGVLLGLAAGADAYSESRRPTYVLVRTCRWC